MTHNMKRWTITAMIMTVMLVASIGISSAAVQVVPLQKILKLKQNFSFTSKNIKKQNIS